MVYLLFELFSFRLNSLLIIFRDNKTNMAEGWECIFTFVIIVILCTKCDTVKPLYLDDDDDVISLTASAFNRTVYGTSNAWLVEFYSSWCGHCIRFAPMYKQLSADIKGIVALGSVIYQEVWAISRELFFFPVK